ncbi:unnamed protein product, partial [Ectocarpus sp. 12 AP-2014]
GSGIGAGVGAGIGAGVGAGTGAGVVAAASYQIGGGIAENVELNQPTSPYKPRTSIDSTADTRVRAGWAGTQRTTCDRPPSWWDWIAALTVWSWASHSSQVCII